VLKLQANPTFICPVEIPTPEGPVTVRIRYKHMTVDAYNEFIARGTPNKSGAQKVAEAIAALATVRRLVPASEEQVSALIQTLAESPMPEQDPADPPREAISNEDAIMECVDGWVEKDVDAPFSRESVVTLCQQYHAAAATIVDEFIVKLTQFKRKN